MKKGLYKLPVFILILAVVLASANQVLSIKNDNGISQLDTFYHLPENSVDILFVGTSRIYSDIDHSVLWREHGVSSYSLASSSQRLCTSYYWLKEALQTQKPKLIVLDAFYCVRDANADAVVSLETSTLINATLSMKSFEKRYEIIKAYGMEKRLFDFVIPSILYHDRYQDLSREDFLPYKGREEHYKDWKGANIVTRAIEIKRPVSFEVSEENSLPMDPQAELFFRRILEEANQASIPILIINPPYTVKKDEAKRLFSAMKIAKEYHASFIDFNMLYDELQLDFKQDFRDSGHFNFDGSQKFSHYLGHELHNRYDLPDHRGDPYYDSWERNALYMDQCRFNSELLKINDFGEYLSLLRQNDLLTVAVSIDGQYVANGIDPVELLQSYRINVPDGNGVLIYRGDETFYRCGKDNSEYHMELGSSDMLVQQRFSERIRTSIVVNQKEQQKVNDGINIVVYNSMTNELVDAIGFDAGNNYLAVR